MRAPLRIFLLVIALLVGAIFALWAFAFWTPPGRSALKAIAESQLSSATGGEVSIERLGGALPGAIVIENARFMNGETPWLVVRSATLDWKPLALTRGDLDIQRIAVAGAVVSGRPPKKPDEEKPRGFQLPERLPSISIGAVTLNDIEVAEALAGRRTVLSAKGTARTGGKIIDIELDAQSADETDRLRVRAHREDETLLVDLEARSPQDGALAALFDFGGAIAVKATGDGPLHRYKIAYDAALGAYGSYRGEISGDFGAMDKIALTVSGALGDKLNDAKDFTGPTIDLDGAFTPRPDGGAVTLTQFRSALGDVSGTIGWRNRNKALDQIDLDLSASLAADWREDIRRYIGDDLAVVGSVRPKGEQYTATVSIDAGLFNAELSAVETDLRSMAAADIDAVFDANPALPPPLNKGGSAQGRVDIAFGDRITGAEMTVTTPDGAGFVGDAHYAFDAADFSMKGEISATPQFLSALSPDLAATKNAAAVVDIKGTIETFGGSIVATLPQFTYRERPLPAMRVTLAVAEAPSAPSGKITARALDGSLTLDANFARTADGGWKVRGVDYIGKAFALKGSADVAVDNGRIALDLVYRGADGAEPWPGLLLVGDLTANGDVNRKGAMSGLQIRSQSLTSSAWTVSGFSAEATGPSSALAVKAKAGSLTIKGAAPLENIETQIIAAIASPMKIAVNAFTADIAGAPLKLSKPATITLAEGVQIGNFRAVIGRNGELSFDGAFSDKRWRGNLVAKQAPIVSAGSVIDLTLDLDTQRQAPASGTFALASRLTGENEARMAGKFSWDGRRLHIEDDASDKNFKLSLALPARLTRAPALTINMDGPLTGAADFTGRVETIVGFLPAVFQSAEGDLSFHGDVSGTTGDPKLSGALTIANGAFTELASGLSVVNIDAKANASSARSGSTISFSAEGAGPRQKTKTVLIDGEATIGKDQKLRTRVKLDRARLTAGPIASTEATGEIELTGPFDDLLAKGDIKLRSLDAEIVTPETTGLVDIHVVALNGDNKPSEIITAPQAGATIRYDIHIEGDDRLFVRGRGLESEWRAKVAIEGSADKPVILGTMSLRDGEITFAGRRFSMTRGEIEFDRLSPNNPSLDIRAERQASSGTTAEIRVEGRALALKISLQSTPSLPQEDVMALLLFDKPANELSAFESLQVAEGLAELGGIGPFGGQGLTGSARQALGLDLLNIDVDEEDGGASSLTVGKYVADGLFVSATQDARGEKGSVRIEYEINDSFTVETELRQDGDQTVSANWKRDF